MTDEREDIKALLDAGKRARMAIYLGLLNSLNAQKNLSPPDYNMMLRLEDELGGKLTNAGIDEPETNVVKNLLRSHEYLQAQGYQIAQRTLYKHAKEGLIKPNQTGTYNVDDLDRYASLNLNRVNGAPANLYQERLEKYQLDKLEATTRIAIEQAQLLQKKNEDLDKKIDSIVGRELVKRENFFKLYLGNYFIAEAPTFVETVHGDHQFIPDFIEVAKKGLNTALGRLVQHGPKVSINASGELIL